MTDPQTTPVTKEEAIAYCNKHRQQYLSDVASIREFDCLISCLESGHIKPEELPSYGMYFSPPPVYPNGQPMFAKDGMMLDENGNRSIFDDVDA